MTFGYTRGKIVRIFGFCMAVLCFVGPVQITASPEQRLRLRVPRAGELASALPSDSALDFMSEIKEMTFSVV